MKTLFQYLKEQEENQKTEVKHNLNKDGTVSVYVAPVHGNHARLPKKVDNQIITVYAEPVHGSHSRKKGLAEEEQLRLPFPRLPLSIPKGFKLHSSGVKIGKLDNWLGLNPNQHLGDNSEDIQSVLHDQYSHDVAISYPIRKYTSSSRDVNSYLIDRAKHLNTHGNLDDFPKGYHAEEQENHIKGLDEALHSHSTQGDLHVYSGLGFHPGLLASQSPKRVLHLPAYMSTSVDKQTAAGFSSFQDHESGNAPGGDGYHILHFHMPAGHKGFYVGGRSKYDHEKEFILPRDTKWHIGEKPDFSLTTGWNDDEDDPRFSYHVWKATPYRE